MSIWTKQFLEGPSNCVAHWCGTWQ
ncbi:LOW QUALITY PROTEIN: hypothetical protein TorRG33x02_088790 [Trema orientale]|uniref:Uncharacterized protein n=1 Tax=Trema orientale TaxID=63057 RepID=A0A2P5FC22_TREOI|nr:LOW QUALITY PROTEIN: hypothetical protein TorRG33x02_088790 [Trema orientale]